MEYIKQRFGSTRLGDAVLRPVIDLGIIFHVQFPYLQGPGDSPRKLFRIFCVRQLHSAKVGSGEVVCNECHPPAPETDLRI